MTEPYKNRSIEVLSIPLVRFSRMKRQTEDKMVRYTVGGLAQLYITRLFLYSRVSSGNGERYIEGTKVRAAWGIGTTDN